MWSEDSTFQGTRKTQYEEYIFRYMYMWVCEVGDVCMCMCVCVCEVGDVCMCMCVCV